MSIPWRGCSAQHVAELATAVATFLAPIALILLSKRITNLARKARETEQAHSDHPSLISSVSSDLRKEDLYCFVPFLKESTVDHEAQEEGSFFHQDAPRRWDENRNEADQQSARRRRQQAVFCVCDSSVNELSGNLKTELASAGRGEIIGDCNKKPLDQMDPLLFSKEFQQELAQACDLLGEQNIKLDSTDSDHGTVNKVGGKGATKTTVNTTTGLLEPVETPTCRSTLERNEWERGGSCTDLMDQLKHLTIGCNMEQSFPWSHPSSSTTAKDANRTEDLTCSIKPCSVDKRATPSDSEKKVEAEALSCSSYGVLDEKMPRNEESGLQYETKSDTEARDSRTQDTKPDTQENRMSKVDDSDLKTVFEDSTLKASTECFQYAKNENPACVPRKYNGRKSSEVDGPTSERGKGLNDFRAQNIDAVTPENRRAFNESAAEPREAFSPSSSCESFSTANCSTSCSIINLVKNDVGCLARQSDNRCAKVNSDHRADQQDPLSAEPADRKKNRKGRRTHGCKVQEDLAPNVDSAVIIKLKAPSPAVSSSTRGRLRHREYGRRSRNYRDSPASDESQVTLDTSDESSESDDEGGSQAEAEEEETQDITKWLASALMSWLPDFRKGGRQTQHRQPTEPGGSKTSAVAQKKESVEFDDDNDERFDVRNVLKTKQQQSLWSCIGVANTKAKACPHSCVSSLCNFRRTLESWKIQLLAMHTALDASALGSGSSSTHWRCDFCKEEKPRSSDLAHHQCYTLHIARVFWRMVLQFKRSHLQTSTCPYISGNKQRGVSSQEMTGGEGVDSEPCSLGHRHSCDNDYSGCSQLQNTMTPVSGEDAIKVPLEAPCVHVLLDDVDKLLKSLEHIKQSYSSSQSSGSQLSDQQTDAVRPTKISEHDQISSGRRNVGQGSVQMNSSHTKSEVGEAQLKVQATLQKDEVERPSREKSSPSVVSPSPSISLPGELADLEEELISRMQSDYTARSSSECTERDTEEEYLDEESVSAHEKPALGKIEQEKEASPECLSEVASSSQDPPPPLANQEMTGPASLPAFTSSDSQVLLPTSSRSGLSTTTDNRRSSMSQQLAACSTRALGKFALRYLEHIEKKLDEEILGESAPSPDKISSRRMCSGDSLKTLKQAALLALSSGEAQIHPCGEMAHLSPTQQLNNTYERLPALCSSETARDSITKLKTQCVADSDTSQHSSAESIRQTLAESLKGAQKDPSLVSAFRDIISDLNKLQSGQQVSRCRMVNAKATLPGLKKSRSMVNASSLRDSNSPRVQSAVPSSSSCMSLLTSSGEEDVGQKDMSVTQAFDQLDKVVNDLLYLIDV